MKAKHQFLRLSGLFILIFLSGCLYETEVDPQLDELSKVSAADLINKDAVQQIENNKNKLILYLEMNKLREKLEVNRNQATLNFDNYEPAITRLYTKEKFQNLKNFRAQNNLLREVPDFAINQGIKRINVSGNRLEKLPYFRKNTSLLLLDLSYNKLKWVKVDHLRKMALPKGATLDLTKTGISCKIIHEYMKRHPEVTVIHDCEKVIVVKK